MNSEKAGIRHRIRDLRGKLSPEWIAEAGLAAQNLVQSTEEWGKAGRVFSYIALPREVQTDALARSCWRLGKRLYVPAFRRETGRYEPALYEGEEALKRGFGGVPEPANPAWAGDERQVQPMDFALIPGLAFDRRGCRVGHGSAHYDRLLATPILKSTFKLGLAFEFQMLDSAPCDSHDVRMDAVATEKEIYRFESL